jgi:hypothetical protein
MCWRRATIALHNLASVTQRRWYRGLAVRGSDYFRVVPLGARVAPLAALAALVAGCGESRHQDAGEPRGVFTVQVARASFPLHQAVARPERLVLDVRNIGTRTVPNVTVAVTSFYHLTTYPGVASPRRPTWVVDQGPGTIASPPVETVQVDPPGGGTTANYDIWALGPLAPGATRSFVWHVSPVKPGVQRVSYRVYAGLNGRARAQLVDGAPPAGSFTVNIADRPPPTHVNPATGRVAAGPYVP